MGIIGYIAGATVFLIIVLIGIISIYSWHKELK